MIRVKEAVIVEGRYDKIRLSSLIDGLIITTDGFGIFKNKEKMNMLRHLARTRGLLVLTDSDAAGFVIRNHLQSCIPPQQIRHAYIPDIEGKERRKTERSKEGKLGVEGMTTQILLQALEKAGVFCTDVPQPQRSITHADLYADGFSGTAGSRSRRAALLQYFDLPERLNKGALLKVLNTFVRYDEYRRAADALREENR